MSTNEGTIKPFNCIPYYPPAQKYARFLSPRRSYQVQIALCNFQIISNIMQFLSGVIIRWVLWAGSFAYSVSIRPFFERKSVPVRPRNYTREPEPLEKMSTLNSATKTKKRKAALEQTRQEGRAVLMARKVFPQRYY